MYIPNVSAVCGSMSMYFIGCGFYLWIRAIFAFCKHFGRNSTHTIEMVQRFPFEESGHVKPNDPFCKHTQKGTT